MNPKDIIEAFRANLNLVCDLLESKRVETQELEKQITILNTRITQQRQILSDAYSEGKLTFTLLNGYLEFWTHIKTGEVYEVLTFDVESKTNGMYLPETVIYRKSGKVFCREKEDFLRTFAKCV
jgi:hypothetical protein